MAKKYTIIYKISIVILVFMIPVSMILPFFTGAYVKLGYPAYLMYFLPIAKVLGLTVILSNKSDKLREWANAGFTFLFIIAIFSHVMAGDNRWPAPAIPLVALGYIYYYRYKSKARNTTSETM